jgi:HPt (histidine-containing phosphotransfer) domain-containing protein
MEKHPININKAKYIVDGDRELLKELVQIFMETYPGLLERVEEAITQQETSSFRHETHQIKGALRNFAAEPAQLAASELESADVRGDPQQVKEKLENLKTELAVLETYFRSGELEKQL